MDRANAVTAKKISFPLGTMVTIVVPITVTDHDMPYKERRIWYFQCRICQKKRRKSHTRFRAKEALCRPCMDATRTDKAQPSLFGSEAETSQVREGCQANV